MASSRAARAALVNIARLSSAWSVHRRDEDVT
jgi:hypothetical protein